MAKSCKDGGCWCATTQAGVDAQQWGGAASEAVYGVAIGSDAAPVAAGWITGSTAPVEDSAFVSARHSDPDAVPDWTVTWSTHKPGDRAASIVVDSSGEAFVAGQIYGAFAGATYLGGADAALSKLDAAHSTVWSKQWGSGADDIAKAVARTTSGNLLVTGSTTGSVGGTNPMPGNEDVFLSQVGNDGTIAWTKQWGGTGRDVAAAITVDAQQSSFVTGVMDGDVFCAKRDSSGNQVWSTTWGSAEADSGTGVVLLADGGLMVVGFFGANATGIIEGAFVSKLDANGKVLWNHQLGVSSTDYASAITLGPNGDAFVAGFVTGDLVAGAGAGDEDAFVYRLRPDGTIVWKKQVGSTGNDRTHGIAVAPDETVYVGIETFGAYPGFGNQGQTDAALLRFTP